MTPALRRILIIDDEEEVGRILSRILGLGGFDVLHLMDGETALKTASKEPERFAAALVDLHLPNLDGQELARRLRAIAPGMRVLFMTGDAGIDPEALKPLGALLLKPFTSDSLFDALARALA